MSEGTFQIINDEGKVIECEVLFTYEDDETGKNFIGYTDNTVDKDGNTMVYASLYDPNEDDPDLIPIEDDRDWELVGAILEALTEE